MISWLHIAAEIRAVDFYVARNRLAFVQAANRFPDFVAQYESRFILAVQIAGELQGAVALGTVHEDGDRQEDIADCHLAVGEDGATSDAVLVRATLALPCRARLARVGSNATAAGAIWLTGIVAPPDRYERRVRFLISHARNSAKREAPCCG